MASLSGVSKYLFTPLALGVVLSMFASYAFAMTVIPLFCAMFLKPHAHAAEDTRGTANPQPPRKRRFGFQPTVDKFNYQFQRMVNWYERLVRRTPRTPRPRYRRNPGRRCNPAPRYIPVAGPRILPRTDPGQFVINVRMPSGTRLEVSNQYIAKVENIIRRWSNPPTST